MKVLRPLLAVALIGMVAALGPSAHAASVEHVPQAGISLFDEIFSVENDGVRRHDIPFPFSRLRSELASRLGLEASDLKEVLLPLGRALQREAAAPHYYRFPRHVLVVDTDSKAHATPAPVSAKDRLFIGYQEKANSLEIISYNETAGRFEFQVVDGYAPGKTPRVRHAQRTLCVSCHQGETPLFPEAPWSETGANPQVRTRLSDFGQPFHGLAVRPTTQAAEHARAITNAVERANRLPALNAIWQRGCGAGAASDVAAACRANLFLLALMSRLSTSPGIDMSARPFREVIQPAFLGSWAKVWPGGLPVQAHLIPDRDPIEHGTDVPPEFDPLTPRAPHDIWHADRRRDIAKAVSAIAETFAEPHIRLLDAYLAKNDRSSRAQRNALVYTCSYSKRGYFDGKLDRVLFYCTRPDRQNSLFNGYVYFEPELAPRGRVDVLQLPNGENQTQLKVEGDTSPPSINSGKLSLRISDEITGRSVRRADGWALESVQLSWNGVISENFDPSAEIPSYPRNGKAVLTFVDDVARVRSAIDNRQLESHPAKKLFADSPFDRNLVMAALFNYLGLPHRRARPRTMRAPSALSPTPNGAADRVRPSATGSMISLLEKHCGACHQSASRFPPNFLMGSDRERARKIADCSARIAYRLAMWLKEPDARAKSPMPPPAHLKNNNLPVKVWGRSKELSAMLDFAAKLSGGEPLSAITNKTYSKLPRCTP